MGLYIVVYERTGFFRKKSPLGKNGQKFPQNRVFGHFKKINSLFLSGIGVK